MARAQSSTPTPWAFFGADIGNTRASLSPISGVNSQVQINPRNIPRLALKWSFSTIGDVSATPTVEQGGLYVPDYAGWLYKLDPDTGAQIWAHAIAEYAGYGYTRTSPALGALGELVIGSGSTYGPPNPGARVIAIDRTTGLLRWRTTVDSTLHSYITTSPVIYNHRVYVGVASSEEVLAASVTATFRGSVVALDEATGAIVWQFSTVPPGYTGGSVWGSSPAVFKPGKSLLIGTGNNVSMPAAASLCVTALGAGASAAQQLACTDPTNYADSVLSLDLATGTLNWARRFEVDAWTNGCSVGPVSTCPTPAGLDDDFASAPNLAWVPNFVGLPDDRGGTSQNYLLGIGQKSGYYRGLNPYDGGMFWETYLGRGQILWGSAINTDDLNAVYVALDNRGHSTNSLAGRNGRPVSWNGGAWASLALATGQVNWQIPSVGMDTRNPLVGGASPGPLTFSNRVLFAGSTSGWMVALSAITGWQYWSYNAGGPIIGGPAVFNETLYWGAGATRSGPGSVHTVFAFSVPPLAAAH